MSTETSRVGDRIEAQLTDQVEIGGQIVLPVGTSLSGCVTQVVRAEKKRRAHALLVLTFDEITLPDGRATLDAPSGRCKRAQSNDRIDEEPAASRSKAPGAWVSLELQAGRNVGMATPDHEWAELDFQPGRKMSLRLVQDLTVPTREQTALSTSANPASAARASPPAPPAPACHGGAQPPCEADVFLAYGKSWQDAAKLLENPSPQAKSGGNEGPPPPLELIAPFVEACMAAAAVTQPTEVDYVVLVEPNLMLKRGALSLAGVHSISVYRRDGRSIYAGGDMKLSQAFKQACEAIASDSR